MKLTKVRITAFQSIQDSNEVDIGDITCLVGKNKSGKTAFLKALYHLNPINESDGNFDVTDDYPRGAMADYEDDVRSGRRKPAEVVHATYELDPETINLVEAKFGPKCLKDEKPTLTISKGYSNELTFDPTFPIWLNIPLSKSSAFFKPLSICETLAVGMAIITP